MRAARAAALALLLLLAWCVPAGAEGLSFENFGELTITRPQGAVRHVVILLSHRAGMGRNEAIAARRLADGGALVIGVNSGRYLRNAEKDDEECPNVSLDLENMSKFVQQSMGLPRLFTPVLVGLGAGSAMVYANLVQAPPETFLGGVSVNFRPQLTLRKPFCQGKGLKWTVWPDGEGLTFAKQTKFNLNWVVLKPTADRFFAGAEYREFVRDIPGARTIPLVGLNEDLEIEGLWAPQLEYAVSLVLARAAASAAQLPPDLASLPLTEVRDAAAAPTDALAVFISGDGGWAGMDRDMATFMAAHGLPVVGVDSLRYFWRPRDPEGGAADLARILRHYLKAWKREKAVLVGYSLGAEALPSMASRLPADLRARLRLVTLMAPGRSVDLAFEMTDWLASGGQAADKPPLKPEVLRLAPTPVLCLWGQEEQPEDSLCPTLSPGEARVMALPGSHHFDGKFEELAEIILREAGLKK